MLDLPPLLRGVAAGAGRFMLAVSATGIVVIILAALIPLERALALRNAKD